MSAYKRNATVLSALGDAREVRERFLTIRLSEAEFKEIGARARALGRTASDYVRCATLGSAPLPDELVTTIVAAVKEALREGTVV